MRLYSEFMSWASYAKAELVKAEIDEARIEGEMRVEEARAMLTTPFTKGDRVTITKAQRDASEPVIAQRESLRQAHAYRKLVDVMFDRCERSAQVLSRELSRRIGMAPRENKLWKHTP